MKQAVNKRYLAQFDLVPFWVPQVLQDWLEEGWAVDITVKRIKGRHGAKWCVWKSKQVPERTWRRSAKHLTR